MKGILMKIKNWTKEEVELELKKKLILGDKSDGIHGIKKGWGPKTCEKNMKNLESFLETDDDMKARYNFNKIMIDMTEIPDEIVDEIKTLYNKSQPGYNNIKLLTFCRELRLVKIAEDVGKFRFK